MVENKIKIISNNRKAFYNFEILDRYEAGIVLQGSEVKTLRTGTVSLQESYIDKTDTGELQLLNCYIEDYKFSTIIINKHNEKRPKKLLLHKKEILKISNGISKKGYTAVPLKMYFKNGIVKLEIALAKGKTEVDKRHAIKEKDWKREHGKIIKEYNIKV